jgi:predicted Zn-ribbon and HTH transcriptional regulator
MTACTCLKCGNKWKAYVNKPKMCPACKRRDWSGECNSLGVPRNMQAAGVSCHCKQCGNEWVSRVGSPKMCPTCKRYNWNDEAPARFHCVKCGHEWAPRGDGVPVICPACKRYNWNDEAPAREVPCYRCGAVYAVPVDDATGKPARLPERCPSCYWVGWNVERNPACGWCGGVGCDRCQSEQPAPGCGVVVSVVPPVIRRGVLLPCFWCGGKGCEWCGGGEGDGE